MVDLTYYDVREGYEAKEAKGKGKDKGGADGASGGGASGPYVQRVMDDAREDEMEVRRFSLESNGIESLIVIVLIINRECR